MSAPLVPSPLDYIGRRRFSFYPPIRNTAPNDWLLGHGSWSEVQVVNAERGFEIWIPRQYIGGVSDGADSRVVVELTNELGYDSGGLSPTFRRVIEIPQGASAPAKPLKKRGFRRGPASVIGIRLESGESTVNRILAKVAAVGAIVLCILAGLMFAIAHH
ncbi:MAG: hypothetical protein JOZ62_24105 [Acidobacteriaceae bacterium]|nr:hypothetical protein [Acidobacteriaceae bacterium]